MPKTRADWWASKLNRNVERDNDNQAKLEAAGWRICVVWECRVRGNPDEVGRLLAEFLRPPGAKEKGGPPG